MVVYADVIWLLNFCIDGLLLLLTAVILKRKVKRWKVLLGAFIGSTIVIFAFTPFAYIMNHPIAKLLYSVVMVYTVFGFQRFRTFFQTVMMFYFVTFMVGGGLIGLHYFIQSDILPHDVVNANSISFGDPVSWLFVLIGFPIILYFSKQRIESIEVKKLKYDQIVKVNITIGEQTIEIDGLIDSGNQLYDPISKLPVMILDVQHARELFPAWLIEHSKNIMAITETTEDPFWLNRLRIIPYRGVGQQHQFLAAIRPDAVHLLHNGENHTVTKVLIGLNHTTLSTDNEYHCILHPKMFLSYTA
ncbi:sigma-E processing peptidase SpoIIGA [Bacillus sp. 165]|uniref:sigma-E processing peptidase SpoIIGA n=1 Tax=Bacillus sp. 165 TaxID=1529117 RepID=UPI001AD955DC|nr:sigma-E processing peptidase SpoIIGA [Bacillus sp. 165]MBO9130256.1 sigma-E processing peptidase SpoIIGA [Bacillus sp. 165]